MTKSIELVATPVPNPCTRTIQQSTSYHFSWTSMISEELTLFCYGADIRGETWEGPAATGATKSMVGGIHVMNRKKRRTNTACGPVQRPYRAGLYQTPFNAVCKQVSLTSIFFGGERH